MSVQIMNLVFLYVLAGALLAPVLEIEQHKALFCVVWPVFLAIKALGDILEVL